MKITKSLIPNCSEFAFYIDLSKSDKRAVAKFNQLIDRIKQSEEDNKLEEFGCYEIPSIDFDVIFGINACIIRGNTGDHGTTLSRKIEETGVIFEDKEL